MSSLSINIDHRGEGDFRLRLRLSLPARGVTGVSGPSGSGKTTLLNCIAGLRPDIRRAEIRFGAHCWQSSAHSLPAWKRGVGCVFQDARLFPHLSVAGNLDYAGKRAFSAAPDRDRVIDWLKIGALLPRRIGTLSAGQGQRVAIARALLGAPRLLLLDEPLANLDRPAARECLDCLLRISRESDLPMLYVSHHIEEVAALADQLILMRDGAVEAQGDASALLSRLDTSLAADEGAAAVLVTQATGRRADGLEELWADGRSLYVARRSGTGQRQRLRIAARDVSVCRQRPTQTSILNIMPVTLVDWRSLSDTHCLLRLRLEEQHLLARITERSRHELALQAGDALYAQIKSTALLG